MGQKGLRVRSSPRGHILLRSPAFAYLGPCLFMLAICSTYKYK